MRRSEVGSINYIPEDKLRDLERKRRQWKKEQVLLREHERRKAKMIAEYEEKRARELGLKKRRRRSRSRSKSRSISKLKSRSRTPTRRPSRSGIKSRDKARGSHNPKCTLMSAKTTVMSEKCHASSSNTPLFKGCEGQKISTDELTKIKVSIHRDIASSSEDASKDLIRDIANPEEIVVKRREGEGSKPIFEREELKPMEVSTAEVSERRTIVALDTTDRPNKNHSLNSSPRFSNYERQRSYSSSLSSRYKQQPKPGNMYGNSDTRDNRVNDITTDGSSQRQYHPKPHYSHHSELKQQHSRSTSFQHSEMCKRREKYGNYCLDRRAENDRLNPRRNDSLPYAESMVLPVYYDNFMRPLMMDSLMVRPSLPVMRGRVPFMLNTYRPCHKPHFVGSDIYRHNATPHQRRYFPASDFFKL